MRETTEKASVGECPAKGSALLQQHTNSTRRRGIKSWTIIASTFVWRLIGATSWRSFACLNNGLQGDNGGWVQTLPINFLRLSDTQTGVVFCFVVSRRHLVWRLFSFSTLVGYLSFPFGFALRSHNAFWRAKASYNCRLRLVNFPAANINSYPTSDLLEFDFIQFCSCRLI